MDNINVRPSTRLRNENNFMKSTNVFLLISEFIKKLPYGMKPKLKRKACNYLEKKHQPSTSILNFNRQAHWIMKTEEWFKKQLKILTKKGTSKRKKKKKHLCLTIQDQWCYFIKLGAVVRRNGKDLRFPKDLKSNRRRNGGQSSSNSLESLRRSRIDCYLNRNYFQRRHENFNYTQLDN
ncbi:hypothetical protein V1477_021149 [Vespula maculifrons]|uniref:Uncharacterized protein n=1 Tax=Vespula maculifrons TaxID=7453 RepID=A0ABD2AHB6_VESMC